MKKTLLGLSCALVFTAPLSRAQTTTGPSTKPSASVPAITPIQAPDAPKAVGPYSQAIVLPLPGGGRLLFCSGQLPIDPATGELVPGGIPEQTHQVLRNLAAILKAAGGDLNRVVKTTVYLRSMDDFAAMNGVYATYFTATPPARATVAAAGLPKNAMVEIEAVAALD